MILTKATLVLLCNGGTVTAKTAEIISGSVLQFALGTNSRPIHVTGNLTLGATLSITNGGGFTSGTYTLFTYGGTFTYQGVVAQSTPNPNFGYVVDATMPGEVDLIVDTNNTGTAIVAILSPASSSNLSGIVKVQVATTGLVETTTLMVDGNDYMTMDGGSTTFKLPTYLFSNGAHTLSGRVTYQDSGGNVDEAVSSTVPVAFQNNITVEWFDAFQSSLPIIAHVSYAPANWTISITKQDNTPVKTLSGTTSDGNINVTWNGTDSNNSPVPYNALYVITVSASPQSGAGGGSGSSAAMPSYREEPWQTGQTLLARQKFVDPGVDAILGNVLSEVNICINGADRNNATLLSAPLVMAQGGDWNLLLFYITDTRPRTTTQFYYNGHGSANTIGFNELGGGLWRFDVADALQNDLTP